MSLLDLMGEWLSQAVRIERGTPATATSGQQNTYFATVAEDVACQLQIQSGRFFRSAYGTNPAATAKVFFETGTDIAVGDRLIKGEEVWVVDAVNALRDTDEDHIEADVHWVSGGTP